MLHSVILSIGGIPLIYLGDEVGTINDYSYVADPAKAGDSRWVHRPRRNEGALVNRNDPSTVPGRIYTGLTRLIRLRTSQPAICDGEMEVIRTDSDHLFGYVRQSGAHRLLVIVNVSEQPQMLDGNLLRLYGPGTHFVDLVEDREFVTNGVITLAPYQFLWLVPRQTVGDGY
jgi:amylosucrase